MEKRNKVEQNVIIDTYVGRCHNETHYFVMRNVIKNKIQKEVHIF